MDFWKKHSIKMSQYFPKQYHHFKEDIKVWLYLSSYATKADLKIATGIDTSNFALKLNWANLKTKVDELDINKLVPAPVDLSKISDAVKNHVVKKTVYDKLVVKLNNMILVDLF